MRVRFTPQATSDIDEIANYLKSNNPEAAIRVRNAILDGVKLLQSYPRAGRSQDQAGVRKLVTRKYPYLIYYIIDMANENIAILTIRHAARDREYQDD